MTDTPLERAFVAGALWSGSRSFILMWAAYIGIWAALMPVFGWNNAAFQFALNQPISVATMFIGAFIQFDAIRFARIQAARDKAMHLKLDELLLAIDAARNEFRGIENLPIEAIEAICEGDAG